MIQKLKQAGNSLLAAAGNLVAMTSYELSELLSTQAEEPTRQSRDETEGL